MRHFILRIARRWLGFACALTLAGATTAQAPVSSAAATPCLQGLQAQQAKESAPGYKPKAKKRGWLTAIGAAGGVGIGALVCRGKNGADKVKCMTAAGIGGGALGNILGKKLDAAEQKKVAEASYASAFSGQPAILSFDHGCAVVQASSPLQFEPRDIELSIESDVAVPSGVLRAVGEPQTVASATPVQATAATSRKPRRQLAANSSAFVMGSVAGGKWLLIGSGNPDQGYVGSGYAPAAGWVRQPGIAVPPDAAPPARTVQVKAELPCWTSKVTIRSEGKDAQQDTVDARLCRGPDGVTEAPPVQA